MEVFEKVQALALLMPDAEYDIEDDTNIIWTDTRTMPSDIDLQAIVDANNVGYNNYLKELACREWIIKFYPVEKQNSDAADKAFWEPTLKAEGYVDLELTVVNYIKRFVYDNELYSDIIAGEPVATQYPIGQLIKCGIRLNWVIDCKLVLQKAIADNTIPVYPNFPVIV